MKKCLITFRSVTPAQRGEILLCRAGLNPVLQRTPRWMEPKGCGYCLRMDCRDVTEAVERMKTAGIAYERVYMKTGEEEAEEMNLGLIWIMEPPRFISRHRCAERSGRRFCNAPIREEAATAQP